MINPGLLRDRIVMKIPTSSSIDRYGQSIPTFATSSIWAKVEKRTGNEVNSTGYIATSATYLFSIRNNESVTEKCVIDYESNSYNIIFIDEPYLGLMKITTERRKNNG